MATAVTAASTPTTARGVVRRSRRLPYRPAGHGARSPVVPAGVFVEVSVTVGGPSLGVSEA
ncbi:hypothetical protein Cs7R123_32920 [Catellatospora sp. TT07R-123]|nr:hypothetical protein Cs7R123_32920 [Catellatospora sp. TT07R-123]